MKPYARIAALAATLLAAATTAAPAAGKPDQGYSVVGAGFRMHTTHAAFEDLPFGKGDFSYEASYQYHNDKAYIQLGLDYAPNVSAKLADDTGAPIDDSVEAILTPYLNLVAKDRIYRGGVGILRSLVQYDEKGDDWTRVYWQFLVGVNLPIVMAGVDIQAFYVFEGWDTLTDFKPEDIEFGCSINFAF